MATIRREARYITDLPPDLLLTLLGGAPAPPFLPPVLAPQLWAGTAPSAVVSQPVPNLALILPAPAPTPPPTPPAAGGTGDKREDEDWQAWYLHKKRREEEEEMQMLAVTLLMMED